MIRRFLASLVVLGGLLAGGMALAPAPAAAQFNPLDNACSGDGADAAVCQDKDKADSVTGPNGVIIRATKIITTIAGVAAIVVMVVYGITIIVSYGESGKVTQARNAIIGAAVGLIVIVLARTIVVFVVNRL